MSNAFLSTGQFLVGFYFIFFAFWHVYHWRPMINIMLEEKFSSPILILSFAILYQGITGFMLVLGFYAQIAALALIPFMLVMNCIFHPFWDFHGEKRRSHFTIFMIHLLVTVGALLLIAG